MNSPYFFSGGVSVECRDTYWRSTKSSFNKWTCFYCNSTNTGDECVHCSAPKKERSLAALWNVSPSKPYFKVYKSPWEKVKDFLMQILFGG